MTDNKGWMKDGGWIKDGRMDDKRWITRDGWMERWKDHGDRMYGWMRGRTYG